MPRQLTNMLQWMWQLKNFTQLKHTKHKQIHMSPIGLIPKTHQPVKYRLIIDLSSPHGHSVNDGIKPELCSLEYSSVDNTVKLLLLCGQGALMGKLDLKSAYRMVPVHTQMITIF